MRIGGIVATMSRGSHIVAVGNDLEPSTAHPAPDDAEQAPTVDETPDDLQDAVAPTRSLAWLAPAAALAAIGGWTIVFLWAGWTEMARPVPPSRWIGWISEWSLPVVLIGVLWLIAMRNSRREMTRFGRAAQLLAAESTRLEDRLVAVNRELSLAREFLAAQSRDLSSLGRLATERLSSNADRLQALVHENSAQVESIGAVSSAALENMERLRGQLPVIASTAKDVTNNIANAGRTAHAQLQEMVHGFNRLNEFGQASDRQVNMMREKVGEGLAEFTRHAERLEEITTTRFAALAERGAAFRAELDKHEVEALAAIRARAAALTEEVGASRDLLDHSEAESLTSLRARLSAVRDEGATVSRALRDAETSAVAAWREHLAGIESELHSTLETLDQTNGATAEAARVRLAALADEARHFDDRLAERSQLFTREMERQRKQADDREDAAIARIGKRLDMLDREIAERHEQQQQSATALTAHGESVVARLGELDERFAAVAAQGARAESALSASLGALGGHLTESRSTLAGTEDDIARLTEASVRLLELIQAGAQHSRVDLPAALAQGEGRLQAMERQVFAVRDAVNEAHGQSDGLSAYVLAAGEAMRGTLQELDALHDRIDERSLAHGRTLDEIAASLAAIGGKSADLAAKARGELTSAIEELADTARDAVVHLERDGAAAVAQLAGKLHDESSAAIDAALRERAVEISSRLEDAANQAASVSRDAAVQLRDQLSKVNELAGNLERRVAHARQRAEEQVDNDFARRVAVITESLNSNAIDIAKALSNEVSDTAWSAYLRGDRGIFTRRAVTLVDAAEARSIAQLYEADREFAEHVNRHIHDFEAMLRQLLSTRDGHALGVTLLSSDMGKLYVALAQAIERLRS